MNKQLKTFFTVALTAAAVSAAWMLQDAPLEAQNSSAQAIPRTPDGKPNLSGIWQTMSTANWSLEPA
ncbi:MAG TPA: hypothetical protein VKZ92_08750, partial [Pseudohongiella sp.]|nr:hypothetical protein [Pseudohongiella sp.]